jgi:hypothetical protein
MSGDIAKYASDTIYAPLMRMHPYHTFPDWLFTAPSLTYSFNFHFTGLDSSVYSMPVAFKLRRMPALSNWPFSCLKQAEYYDNGSELTRET